MKNLNHISAVYDLVRMLKKKVSDHGWDDSPKDIETRSDRIDIWNGSDC